MADVLLLHSALGLRPGVHAFADLLRERGHEVTVPDYYEGHVFDEEASGIAHRDAHPEYFEAVGVLSAGLLSFVATDLFPDKTVWSHFGSGYGYLPLVLPFVGLWWLHRVRAAGVRIGAGALAAQGLAVALVAGGAALLVLAR